MEGGWRAQSENVVGSGQTRHVPPVGPQLLPQLMLPVQQPELLRAGLPAGAHSQFVPALLSLREQHTAASVC